ncbi:MAG: ABC transporter ATP-binding protein [Tenericutes bacterium HGW-Tenericutes-3]|nr:MAG: ABC transporter ATP-binding protein [Tenericutes bacterium HGW-Tenericutes-3]
MLDITNKKRIYAILLKRKCVILHLKSILLKQNQLEFPYQLPFFKEQHITFDSPITILVGENGSGKSTFLELINEKLKLYRIEMENTYQKELRDILKKASKDITLKYALTKPQGFFFCAEDFTSYIHFLVREKNEALSELKRIETEYKNKSDLSRSLAKGPSSKTLYEIDNLYDRDLLKSSHGEAYLSFFSSRLRKNQIYLLDEPETPLSIQNQLTLITLIHDAVKEGNQFIIATHSPIVMSIPGAVILSLSDQGVEKIKFDEIESVLLLKQFLNYPDSFFKHLF